MEQIDIVELPEKTVFTRQEAASILGISLTTFDAIDTSELPRLKLGKHVKILRQDLSAFLSSRRTNTTEQGSVRSNNTLLNTTKRNNTRYFKFFVQENMPFGFAQLCDKFGDIDKQAEKILKDNYLPGVDFAEISEDEFLTGVKNDKFASLLYSRNTDISFFTTDRKLEFLRGGAI